MAGWLPDLENLQIRPGGLVNLKKSIFQNLENLEMRVYYRGFQQYFSSVTLSTKFKSTETNPCILFIFRCTENAT